jgi:Clp amino terminal domain, pathogenicity island component
MVTLTRFAALARRTVIRLGTLASEYGRGRLSTEFFLLALAEEQPLSRPVDLGITAAMIRAEIESRTHAPRDRELLAALGVDLDEVSRRTLDATSRAWMTPACGSFAAPPSAPFESPSAARQLRSCSTRAAGRSSRSPNGSAAADTGP